MPTQDNGSTINRNGAYCLACGTHVDFGHIRAEAQNGNMESSLIAIVGEGERSRIYLPPDEAHVDASLHATSSDAPVGDLPESALGFRVQAYDMLRYSDLFSKRQCTVMILIEKWSPRFGQVW